MARTDFLTRNDFDTLFKNLPTKEEFFTKVNEIMIELKAIRKQNANFKAYLASKSKNSDSSPKNN